jgi:hypothetical protein
MRMPLRRLPTYALLPLLAWAAVAIAPPPSTASLAFAPPPGLFEAPYVSTAVKRDGTAHPLFRDAKVHVKFQPDGSRDVVEWRAKCNRFSARVRITARRLHIGRAEMTEQFCPGQEGQQDRWLARFFNSDPRWTLRGEQLRFASHHRVLRLNRVESESAE